MASLKLYFDLLSQPSRSLYIILKKSNVAFEACTVPLRKGVHYTDEYKDNVSKFQKVPVLHDGDFKLTESVAIVRYLSNINKLDEKWYPKNDPKAQARVDEYLEWQHHNIRAFCAMYFRTLWLGPLMTGKPVPEEKKAKSEQQMVESLDKFEEFFLTPGPYVAGDKISVADIFAASEIEQPRICGFDPLEGRPKLSAWMQRVRQEANPYYEEAHVPLNKLASKAVKSKI